MTGLEIITLLSIFIIAGIAAGILAGLLGVGGGIVFVPVLFQTFIFMGIDPALQMHLAVGSSLAVIIVTAIQSARAHHAKQSLDFDIVKRWAPFIVLGVGVGSVAAVYLNADSLKFIFGFLSVLVAIHINLPHQKTFAIPALWLQRSVAASIGFFSSLMGIGGGTFSVAFLTLFGLTIHRAVGTSSALGFFIAVPGTIGFMLAGYGQAGLPPFSVGYVNWLAVLCLIPMTAISAPIGARLAHQFSRQTLERAFSVFLILTALRMFYSLLMA